jgi:hypothetical protein
VLPGEGAQVIWVAGGDDAATQADRSGDDQGVDGMARIQVIPVTQSACLACRRLADGNRPDPAAQDPVDH